MTALDKARETDRPRSNRPRRQRRWPWITAGILGAVMVSGGIVMAASQFGLPRSMGEGDRNHVYDSDAGSLRYQVHLPPQYDGGTPLPVIMAIHGCGMTGYGWNSMKATTQLNRLADREGFIVVYPTQRLFRSLINCWNSADPREQHRGSGEPALLAGVARRVVEEYHADPAQVHVAGASSGAGAAVILAATYPDVFATVTSVAGGEYGLNQVDPDDPDATPPTYTARQAWAQMGDRARQVPLLVIQGEHDAVVPPLVAARLVEHWAAVGDFVDDGLLNGSLPLVEATTTVPSAPGKHAYAHTTMTLPDGTSLIESYLVEDMGHVWPGPVGDGMYTDHAGPDASATLWDFARRHPRPPEARAPRNTRGFSPSFPVAPKWRNEITIRPTISPGRLEVARIGPGAVSMSAFDAGAGRDDAESMRAIHDRGPTAGFTTVGVAAGRNRGQ